jgi:hypothetical protein
MVLLLKSKINALAVPTQFAEAVTKLNILIHRYESLKNKGHGHIDVLPQPIMRHEFEDQDYDFFSPDNVCGQLYLAYGVTGVPVVDAFHNDNTHPPVPQSNFTAGIKLSFHQDSKYEKKEALDQWLKRKFNWSAYDPKMALGYIPLGKIESDLTLPEIYEQIKKHPEVVMIEIVTAPEIALVEDEFKDENLKPAIWQDTKDIQYHLKYNSWIQLPVDFDHKSCLQEGMALLDRFVEHRSYDQSSTTGGKWKSLGINALNGDHTKTLNYNQYTDKEPEYSLTEVAKYCPKTIKFLRQVTDLSKCQRVRFMLLEPGAKISVHSDSPRKNPADTTLAVNIALNMPEECEFWTELNVDGSVNSYSRKLPMKDGTFFLFNNSPYHSVINNSNVRRLHIIIHGPIRFTHAEVLEKAEHQNQLFGRKQLINQVFKKMSLLGRNFDYTDPLYIDWLTSGQQSDLLEPEVSICILEDKIGDQDLMYEATHNISLASLFPEQPCVILFSDLHQWLKKQYEKKASYAVLVGSGTYFKSSHQFIHELLKSIHQMQQSGAFLAGHLMHQSNEQLVYLHEQFVIIDLIQWHEIGEPDLDVPYNNENFEMTEHYRSRENIHDDYTPLWISKTPVDEKSVYLNKKKGVAGFGTKALNQALQSHKKIINLGQGLRQTKMFSYPRAGKDWQYLDIKKNIENFLEFEKNNVFVVNNEPLTVYIPEGFKVEKLICVAGGLKPLCLTHQFFKDSDSFEIQVVDFSKSALSYLKELSLSNSPDEFKMVVAKWFMINKPPVVSHQLAAEHFEIILHTIFEGNFELMLMALHKLRQAEFTELNLLSDVDGLLTKITQKNTYFWHSNAFNSNGSLFIKSKERLNEHYKNVVINAARKLGMQGYAHKNSYVYQAYLQKEDIKVVFSAGYGKVEFNKNDYIELNS